MADAIDTLRIDAGLLRCLTGALRELGGASCAEQIARVLFTHAQRLCHVDCIALHQRGTEAADNFPEHHDDSLFQATLTFTVEGDGPLRSLSAHWCDPHTVTVQETAVLDLLAQAAALAVAALPRETETPAAPGRYLARERARFFDFQRQVRSLLAVVRSIVRRTVESNRSVEDYAAHLEGRLGALARVQGLLLRAPDARVDLEELVRMELLAQSIVDERTRVDGPRILLAGKTAETLGLALHELATNAIKFGALSGPRGTLRVAWRQDPQDAGNLEIEWLERSDTVGEATLGTRGFGFELIERTLPYELNARTSLSMAPDGLLCVIRFPLQAGGAQPRADSLR
jgi:two-component sensor histidine kinase